MADLLHIYDAGVNFAIRSSFRARTADYSLAVAGNQTVKESAEEWKARISHLGVFDSISPPHEWVLGGCKELLTALDNLVAKRMTFRRVIFSTHGNQGQIYIGDEAIDAKVLRETFSGRNYGQLFPLFTRMCFDGCNVAAGNEGWAFLETAGQVFLPSFGGVAFGYASYGLAVPWYHTVHPGGDARYVTVGPGGVPLARYTDLDLVRNEFRSEIKGTWFERVGGSLPPFI